MDDEQHRHLEDLLQEQQRRLRILELQATRFGLHAPPHIHIEIDSIHAEIASLMTQIGVAPHALPAPVVDFVGRDDEIARLLDILGQTGERGAVATISSVRGMGGIGKTQLALTVAQRLASVFSDAHVLIELRGAGGEPLSPTLALQWVIRAFEPQMKLPDDLSRLRSIYQTTLTGKRVLIVADDARDAAQIRPLLPPAGCALLITSRQRFTLPGMMALDLGMLSPEEAERLLHTICRRIGDAAPRLAHLCGYLPLALRVSASVLENDNTLRVERYLERLADERTKLAQLRDPDDPELDVEASLQLSYAALRPVAQDVLCQLSVFGASFDLVAATAVIAISADEEVELVLGLLRRRNLLEWDEAAERYRLHDLVRAFTAARLEAPNAMQLRHAQYYARVAARTGVLYLQGGEQVWTGLALFDRERRHIDDGWTWARARAGEHEADLLVLDYANATAYVSDLWYDEGSERIPQLGAAVAAARRLGRRADEGAALGNLGIGYERLGEAQRAIAYHEQALAIMRELGDRREEGWILGCLGRIYRESEDVWRAIAYHEQALAIMRELGDRREEGKALGNLGFDYISLGDVPRAITYSEQWLTIARELGDKRGEERALSTLSEAYGILGKLHDAVDMGAQALVLAQTMGDRYGMCSSLNNVARAVVALGDSRRARTLGEQALALALAMGDPKSESATWATLARVYAALEDIPQAVAAYDQALAIQDASGHRRGAAQTSKALGLLLEAHGDLARAVVLLQACVDDERTISHVDAEADAAHLEEVRQRLRDAQREPGTE